jgi:hypothetical protein
VQLAVHFEDLLGTKPDIFEVHPSTHERIRSSIHTHTHAHTHTHTHTRTHGFLCGLTLDWLPRCLYRDMCPWWFFESRYASITNSSIVATFTRPRSACPTWRISSWWRRSTARARFVLVWHSGNGKLTMSQIFITPTTLDGRVREKLLPAVCLVAHPLKCPLRVLFVLQWVALARRKTMCSSRSLRSSPQSNRRRVLWRTIDPLNLCHASELYTVKPTRTTDS